MVFPTGWGYKFKFTSDSTKVNASVKGLALDLSNVTSALFWSNVKSDGSDIRITTDEAGTSLVARDVVSIDTTAETGLIRLDTSGISTSADTDYYVYYGNSSATEPESTGVYDSNMVAYYTLNNTTDNKIGTNNLNYQNSSSYVDGFFNTGRRITNKNQTIYSDSAYTTSNISASKWYYYEGTGGSWNTLFCRDGGSNHHILIQDGTDRIGGYWSGSFRDTGFSLTTNTWYRVTFVKTGNTHRIIINGVSQGYWSSSFDNNSVGGLRIFSGHNTSGSTQGALGIHDETMIYDKELSVDEDLTFYNNESDNASFWTINAPSPTVIFSIKGTCLFNGSLVSGAKVSCINQNTNELVGHTTSDENGEWEFSGLNGSDLYHVVASLEDGEDKFNHLSFYDIEPKEEEE